MNNFRIILAVLGGLIVSGCESVKETLGLTHTSPDEFMIDNSPTLFMPDDFHNIKEPTAKDESQFSEKHRNSRNDPSQLAHRALTANTHNVMAPNTNNQLEANVMDQASQAAPHANSSIRNQVNQEAQVDDPNPVTRQVNDWKRQLKENFGAQQPQGKS